VVEKSVQDIMNKELESLSGEKGAIKALEDR